MKKIIDWIKSNKVTAVLVAVVLAWFFWNNAAVPSRNYMSITATPGAMEYAKDSYNTGAVGMPSPMMPQAITNTQYYGNESVSISTDRKIITDNSASLVVKDVSKANKEILNKTTEFGGFMVNTNLNKPVESASGQMRVRIPVEKSQEFIDYLNSIAIKVDSFTMQGTDVTDQYSDLNARLSVLEESYTRIEAIYKKAENVDEMLMVQQQLFSLQDQIDSIKGKKKYIEDTTKTTAFTIYMSTDEFSLPYSPEGKWRPEVTYKLAARALVKDFRGIGNNIIWIAVYAAIWLPLLVAALIVYKLFRRKAHTPRPAI